MYVTGLEIWGLFTITESTFVAIKAREGGREEEREAEGEGREERENPWHTFS